MRSTFSGLNTMVRGINAHQLSLDTTGHNITNGTTPGYSRQRVNLAAVRSQTTYGMFGGSQVGQGVDSTSITRARNVFADKQFWRENSNTEYQVSKQFTFDKLEAIFDESSDSGLQDVINKFVQSWQNLSTNASDSSMRVIVRDKGKSLADNIQRSTTQLQELIEDNNQKLELKAESVNKLTAQIAELNKQIFNMESTGGMANDLRDSRDLTVDQLAALIDVNVTESANGMYSVSSSGNILADGTTSNEIMTKATSNEQYGGRDVTLVFKSTGTPFRAANGELRGIADSIQEAKACIDDMAKMSAFLLTDFNDKHKSGFGLGDATGVNFFGEDGTPDPVTNAASVSYTYNASTGTVTMKDTMGNANPADDTEKVLNTIDIIRALQVNSRFDGGDASTGAKGTDLIAAKQYASTDNAPPDDKEDVASGNNATLLGNLLSTTKSAMLGNTSLASYYVGMMGSLGVKAETVDRKVTNQENIMAQTSDWRSRESGVNWDEELTDMIRFQTGYKACSRCLTTMDEMLDKLINGTGTVGR